MFLRDSLNASTWRTCFLLNPLLSVLPFYLPFCHWISSHYPCRVQVNKTKLVAALFPSNQLYSPSHNLSPFYHLQTTSLAMWQQSILAICMGTPRPATSTSCQGHSCLSTQLYGQRRAYILAHSGFALFHLCSL